MPQTKEVQEFLKVIGPFYEIVEDEEEEEEEEEEEGRKEEEEIANQSDLAGMFGYVNVAYIAIDS